MSHEPECPKTTQREYPADTCPACEKLRAAYQRGRDQMAAAVNGVIFNFPESRRTLSVQRLIDNIVHTMATGLVSQPGEQAGTRNGGESS